MDELEKSSSDEKQAKKYKNISCTVKAIPVNWLLTKDGFKFLKAIIRQGDVEIFKINSIEMMVEFLF